MANNTDSNFTRKIMESFIPAFETERVITKNIDTQLFEGKFNGSSGSNVDVKRDLDYRVSRTAAGDMTSETDSDIIVGKATATVQNYFTIKLNYGEAVQALEMGNLDRLLKPTTTRMVTALELDYANYMMKNTALLSGTVGTPVSSWAHMANAGATLNTTGVPQDGQWCAAINPFTQTALANVQTGLGAGGAAGGLVKGAYEKGVINPDYAGLKVMACNSLGSYTIAAGADRAGTLTASPTATYAGAKDTMTQTLAVTALQANLVVAAGETVTITAASGAVNRLNLATRQTILDASGAAILWTGTVTEGVTLGASGEGNIVVTGPMISESNGQYDTVSQPALSGDVVTLSGSAGDVIQPNLFWHKKAFTLASVPMERLHSTDTFFTTKDGLQFRVSKWADGTTNTNRVRIDFRPAYGVMNPFFAGQLFGTA